MKPWDLLVIGAGPAGCAAAITARQRGLATVVLEAERFPRHHVGESLVRLWTVFDVLGVLDQMEQTFQHKYGSGRIWGASPVPQWTSFDSGDARPFSLQVRRSRFDAILAERATALGADVRFGWRAIEPLHEGSRLVGVLARDADGTPHELYARFTIDASGRSGFLAKHRHLRRADKFYPDLSVFAYLRGAGRFPGSHAGSLFIETVPWGWLWFIPLRDGEVSVGLVCDRDSRPALRQLGLAKFFQAAVASSEAIAWLLRDASVARPATAIASGGYSAASYGGEGWLLAGDAGSFVDPMWATAVANSMRDGIRAASAVHGAISGAVTDEEAVAFHDRYSREQDQALHEIVRYVYGLNTLHREAPFWQARHARLAASPDELRGRGLRWLAKDPAVRYFRAAFVGMGVTDQAVAELDAATGDLGQRQQEADALARRPLADWVPRWAPGWAPTDGIGLDAAGVLRRGLEFGPGDQRLFCGDPLIASTLRLLDGTRDVSAALDAAAALTGGRADGITRVRLRATLQLAHSQGAFRT